jgi:RNA recognition motif-containing protein
MHLYVGNLFPNVSEDRLRQTFEAFGHASFAIISETILQDRNGSQHRCFGFVEMPHQTEAQTAIKNLNKRGPFGQGLNVYEALSAIGRGRSGEQGSHLRRPGYSNRSGY